MHVAPCIGGVCVGTRHPGGCDEVVHYLVHAGDFSPEQGLESLGLHDGPTGLRLEIQEHRVEAGGPSGGLGYDPIV